MIATIHGQQLDLRPLAEAHEPLYSRLYTDPLALHQIASAQDASSAAHGFRAALQFNAATQPVRIFWVIQERASFQALGLIGLSLDEPGGAEVGVLLPEEHQGRGVATQAIAALADHAFAVMQLQRLHTRHDPGHALAAGLMATLGFEQMAPAAGSGRWRWQLTQRRWAASPRRLSTANPLPSGGLFQDGIRGHG
ncbi:MAG: GNAT family N-acetyltransferase [Arenimonas sp.]|uniref:GNAT family N-acetyltransferase n=1 Tax=Arenimonas sp. TaxID=1872635 RepID=UPI0025C438FE|nr:GNAT family N-acetyltransferase [Arenimonas sp.]MBW8367189.1 GNAT family N-acetyltransferase [Arenimonas sp.]